MRLSKEELKGLTATGLLDIVGAIVPKPIGVILPVVGNAVLAAKDMQEMKELKEKINALDEKQEMLIKEKLEIIYNIYIRRKETSYSEMYSIDVVEMFFRGDLNENELCEMKKAISFYCQDGVTYNNVSFCNADTDAVVDTCEVFSDSVVFNLLNPSSREDIQGLIDDVNGILEIETSLNEIKKMNFY